MVSAASLAIVSSSANSGRLARPARRASISEARDEAEPVEALLFLEGFVVGGLLFCEVGVALFELGEEKGAFVSQSSVFVAQSGIFLAQGLGPSLCGG